MYVDVSLTHCSDEVAEGHSAFISVVLRRLGRLFSQSYHVNLLLSGIISSILQVELFTPCVTD